jgi:hypothetical protein
VPLGQKWPSGLGPVGPIDLSLSDLPGFDQEVQVVSWALAGPRWAGVPHTTHIARLDLSTQGASAASLRRAMRSRDGATPRRRRRWWQLDHALGCAGPDCHLACEPLFQAGRHGSKAGSPRQRRDDQSSAPASAVAWRPKGSRPGPGCWGALQPDHAHTFLQRREIAWREGRLEDTRDATPSIRHRGMASRTEPTDV